MRDDVTRGGVVDLNWGLFCPSWRKFRSTVYSVWSVCTCCEATGSDVEMLRDAKAWDNAWNDMQARSVWKQEIWIWQITWLKTSFQAPKLVAWFTHNIKFGQVISCTLITCRSIQSCYHFIKMKFCNKKYSHYLVPYRWCWSSGYQVNLHSPPPLPP